MKSFLIAILGAAAVQSQTSATLGDVPNDCYALPTGFQADCLEAQAGAAIETFSAIPLSDLTAAGPTGYDDHMRNWGTSTVLVTSTITISSCRQTITNCPYTTSPITTVTIVTSTTYCPLTTTTPPYSPTRSRSRSRSRSTTPGTTTGSGMGSSGGSTTSPTSGVGSSTSGTPAAGTTTPASSPPGSSSSTPGGAVNTMPAPNPNVHSVPQAVGDAGKSEAGMLWLAAGLAAMFFVRIGV